MAAMNRPHGRGEHEHAFAVNDFDSIYFTELNHFKRFRAWLQPHATNARAGSLAHDMLAFRGRYGNEHAFNSFG